MLSLSDKGNVVYYVLRNICITFIVIIFKIIIVNLLLRLIYKFNFILGTYVCIGKT